MIQLKEIRKELGITQKQLANELSISIPQISRYESGETAMTPETIIKLCNYLGVSADQLLGHHAIPIYPIYRDATWIRENDIVPEVFSSVIQQISEHLSFLEKELSSIHKLIEDSRSKLNSLEKTEQKIVEEMEQINSSYDNLLHLFQQFERSLPKDELSEHST